MRLCLTPVYLFMYSVVEAITECSLNSDQEYKYVLLRDNHMYANCSSPE